MQDEDQHLVQEEHQGETMLQGYDTISNIDCFKSKTIVDENLWTFIKEKFPDHVESAMSGCDTINVEEVFPCVPSHQFAKQGDIKEEFEDEMKKVREEDRRKREEEERLGEHLAEELENEERRRLEEAQEQETQGLAAARRMWRDMTQHSPATRKRNRSVMDMFKTASPSMSNNSPEIQTPPLADVISDGHDNTTEISEISFDFPTPEEDAEVVVSPHSESQANEFLVLFSPEMIEEQKKIETMLQQEKNDKEFANSLQKETNVFLTPRSARKPSGEKCKKSDVPIKRQLSLLDCSPKTNVPMPSTSRFRLPDSSEGAMSSNPTTVGASPINLKILDYTDGENTENQSIHANKIAPRTPTSKKVVPNAMDLLRRKVEKDIQSNIAGCSYQSEDELLARKLQNELDKESVSSNNSTSDVDTARKFKKSKNSFKSCKVRHKIISCNKCQACLRDNCGKCSSCRDMPKFGGKHVLKQKCVYRKCLQPVKSNCSQCA